MLGIGMNCGPDCAFSVGGEAGALCAPWSIAGDCAEAIEATTLPTKINAACRRHCFTILMKSPKNASATAAR
jgi:hypothetical protein